LKKEKILILGGDSKIGKTLYFDLIKNNFKVLKSTRRKKTEIDEFYLDLSNELNFSTLPKEKYNFVFFCISITSIDYCKKNVLESNNINVNQTIKLIDYFYKRGTFIIYFSTNLVFDGINHLMKYDTTVNPQTIYGIQKVEVENYLLQIPNNAIIRLTKVIDENFELFDNWVNKLNTNESITAFNDMYMAPIWIFDVVNFLKNFISNPKSGIIHFSVDTDISYQDAAIYIANYLNVETSHVLSASYKDFEIQYAPKHTALICNIEDNKIFKNKNPYDAIDKFLFFKYPNNFYSKIT
jgi:dTDP-4-dehydrorhamnose reductase